MAEESKIDQVKELLDSLTTDVDDNGVPEDLKNIIAVGDGVDTEQMLDQLAAAVLVTADGEAKDKGVTPPADPNDIVVEARPANERTGRAAVPAKTVQDLIDAASEPATCMALILDKYITLKINEAFLAAGLDTSGTTSGTT